MNSIVGKVTLANGVEMPQFGLGVYLIDDGDEIVRTVRTSLDLGYRSIDTAAFYDNEIGVGTAIKESGLKREDLFVTTKVWNSDQGYDQTMAAFKASLDKLQLDYLDLYLIHWPVEGQYLETWRALEDLYEEGKVRAIGVCNFQVHHLENLLARSRVKPMVNQIELHPLLSQEELRNFCEAENIKVEAWSPIARGRILDNEVIAAIAKKYEKTAAQIILRWHLQLGNIVIPKSVTESRLRENADIFDFEITESDIDLISSLNENKRFGPDPDNFNF